LNMVTTIEKDIYFCHDTQHKHFNNLNITGAIWRRIEQRPGLKVKETIRHNTVHTH